MSLRRFSIKFSGVGSDIYHDGQLKISYFNAFSAYNADEMGIKSESSTKSWSGGKTTYDMIFPGYRNNTAAQNSTPMIQSYTSNSAFDVTNWQGLYALTGGAGNHYSIYRREYEVYERPGVKITGYYYSPDGQHYYFYEDEAHTIKITPRIDWYYIDKPTMLCYSYTGVYYKLTERVKVFKGDWEPVLIKGNTGYLYDFNITSGRSYQYIMYPADSLMDNDDQISDTVTQIFANSISDQSATYHVWAPSGTSITGYYYSPDGTNYYFYADITHTIKINPHVGWYYIDKLTTLCYLYTDSGYQLADKVSYEGQGEFVTATQETANKYGEPIITNWDTWSICELEPISYDDTIPILKNAYQVNLDQLWMFKYSLETGSQSQNISRNEFQTLGQFPKIGFGESNYVSGEVSALLGDEIIPYRGQGYIERLRGSRLKPLSTNEKTKMLQQWRALVNSKNPKLLRDIKGQSWIVQIMSSTNTPRNFYMNQPDTISFQWKQVEDTKNVVIYANVGDSVEQTEAKGSDEWVPMFRKGTIIDQ